MKSIVITGSSSGIGKASAKYFAAQGWKVAATMRKPEKETELTQIENVSLYQLDVTDQASIDSATAQTSHIVYCGLQGAIVFSDDVRV